MPAEKKPKSPIMAKKRTKAKRSFGGPSRLLLLAGAARFLKTSFVEPRTWPNIFPFARGEVLSESTARGRGVSRGIVEKLFVDFFK